MKKLSFILIAVLAFSAITFAANFTVTCTIDRSGITIPTIPYKDLTLRLPIGDATSADVLVDGTAAPSRIDAVNHRLIFTTKGSSVEVHVFGASAQAQIGSFSTAVLKDDKKWAWSHGFDDNNSFLQYSVERFNQYGWAGTLFLIGQNISADSIDWTGKEVWWQVTDPHMRRLHKLGWAMGNHSWSHSGGGSVPELQKCTDRIRQALAPTDPSYKPAAFAGPMLSHDYDTLIQNRRLDPNGLGVLFNEGQGNESGNMRIDVNGPAEKMPWAGMNCVTNFNDGKELWIPRFCKTYCFFNPSSYNSQWATDRPLTMIIDSIVKYSNSDDQHHYWFNSLEHGSDGALTDTDKTNDSCSVLGLVPYLYKHYGPGGDNTIWVAPSENIFSYVITQRHSTVTSVTIAPYTGSKAAFAVSAGRQLTGPRVDKSIVMGKVPRSGMVTYDLRGQQVGRSRISLHGLYIIKSK